MSAPLRPAAWSVRFDDAIESLAWSPDGLGAAIAGVDGRVWLIDSRTGKVTHALSGHRGGAFQVAWHCREPIVASSGQDGAVRLWNPGSGLEVDHFVAGAAWVEKLAWSPQGEWLAAGAGRHLVLWAPDRGVVHRLSGHRSTITALCWRADGKVVACACYAGVHLWEALTGQPREVLPWKTSLISVAWSPDGRWVVAGTQEQTVQIWRLPFQAGEELAMSGYLAKVRELAWHHSSRYLATGGGAAIMVWDCGGQGPAGTEPRLLTAHVGRVTALDYQHSGHVLASGGSDGSVFLWNAGRSDQPLREFRLGSSITQIRWSRDDSAILAGCQDGSVALLHPAGV